jgi:biotin synthase
MQSGELIVTAELSKSEILQMAEARNAPPTPELYARADAVRKQNVGDAVHLRGLIEISSHCRRQCMYCGLRKANRGIAALPHDEGRDPRCARQAVQLGYGTVVMQAGEDDA